MEFPLRSSVPDSTILKALSGADHRLQKSLLLRTLHSHLINASLSEASLEILQQLHLNDAVPSPDSLRRAFCAVAVECTVKYLVASPDDPSGEYFSAVHRIWRGRVAALTEEGRTSGLVSEDLERWRVDVEAALWDPRVSERIAGLNTRWVAMVEVRGYLKEAWEIMGPDSKGLCLQGVCENDSASKCGDGGLECSAKRADRNEFNDNNDDNGTDDDGACHMEGVPVTDENQGKEQSEDTVVDVPAKGDQDHVQKGKSVLQKCQMGVQISAAEKVEPQKQRSSNYDPLPSDALHTSEVVRSDLAMKVKPHIIENESDVCMSIVPFLPNNADLRKKSSVNCSNVDRANLMERKSSAQTHVRDDSIDNLRRGMQPKRRKLKWTSLEEETLRAGVKMFGEGNWTTIRNSYSSIFQNRTAVDLKDKWRNLLR